jgi:DNA-binding protein HU-beta
MNKAELVQKLLEKAGGCSKAEAERYLDAFVEVVTEALKAGDEVAIAGFGTFSVKTRAARTGVNPKTGEKIQIPSMKTPKFKAGKTLKDALK